MKTHQIMFITLAGLLLALLGTTAIYTISVRQSPAAQPNTQEPRSNGNPAVDYSTIDLAATFQRSPICLRPSEAYLDKLPEQFSKTIADISKQIDSGWELDSVCFDPSSPAALAVSTKPIEQSKIPATVRDTTLRYFSSLGSSTNPNCDECVQYRFSVFASADMQLAVGEKTKEFKAGALETLTELVWNRALAGCSVEEGHFSRAGAVTVACGHGDNGCYSIERVSVDLFSGALQRLNVCTKNCDLAEGQMMQLSCRS